MWYPSDLYVFLEFYQGTQFVLLNTRGLKNSITTLWITHRVTLFSIECKTFEPLRIPQSHGSLLLLEKYGFETRTPRLSTEEVSTLHRKIALKTLTCNFDQISVPHFRFSSTQFYKRWRVRRASLLRTVALSDLRSQQAAKLRASLAKNYLGTTDEIMRREWRLKEEVWLRSIHHRFWVRSWLTQLIENRHST